MNRIYYSRECKFNEWPQCKFYWFPFAEKLMHYKFGWWIIRLYLTIRGA